MDSRNDTPEIEAQRNALHDACFKAFEETGSVRTPEWIAAKNKLTAFEAEYGSSYNPD